MLPVHVWLHVDFIYGSCGCGATVTERQLYMGKILIFKCETNLAINMHVLLVTTKGYVLFTLHLSNLFITSAVFIWYVHGDTAYNDYL